MESLLNIVSTFEIWSEDGSFANSFMVCSICCLAFVSKPLEQATSEIAHIPIISSRAILFIPNIL
jgi:hypothetical protein